MRTVAMCFSILQVPRCRAHALTSSWFGSFHQLSRTSGNISSFRVLGSGNQGLDGGHTNRWSRRPIYNTKTSNQDQGNKQPEIWIRENCKQVSKKAWIEETRKLRDGSISTRTELNINKSEILEFPRIEHCANQQKIVESRDLASLVTIIVFDIETTGFSRTKDWIIEIALQDLFGGENSTFQTLVNPERSVPNSHVHGISTSMVNRPDVPRMKDLIPILHQYVKSRQKDEALVLWIAHNARTFDVPFLIKEFNRCSFEIPPDWLFMDTLPLAREVMKLGGGSKVSSKISLQALREYYGIPLLGSAHRAMSDVNTLSMILQRMTFDLKLPVSGLLERSFRASDLNNVKKKKTPG